MKIIKDRTHHEVLKPEEYLDIGGFISRPALDHAYYVKHKYDIYNLMNINKEYDQILHKDGKWSRIIGQVSTSSGPGGLLEVLITDAYTLNYIKHMMHSEYMLKIE